MPWLLDGNNLAQGEARERVRAAALALVRGQKMKVVIVFDGVPPPGSAEVEKLGQVEVRYAPDADLAILKLLASEGGREWTVATDDQELAGRARQLGAETVPGGVFWARVGQAVTGTGGTAEPAMPWSRELEYFGDPRNRLPAGPVRVVRRRGGRRHER